MHVLAEVFSFFFFFFLFGSCGLSSFIRKQHWICYLDMDFIYICGADMLYMFKILELLCLYQEFIVKFGITFEISHL